MFMFKEDNIRDLISEYAYLEDTPDCKRNPEVADVIQETFEALASSEIADYPNGEVSTVLNILAPPEDDDDFVNPFRKKNAALKKIKPFDIAFIALHYGFMYGACWAENQRLNFM